MVNFHFSFKAIRNQLTIDELIERMELNHARDKYISNFSSGMRQRLKLGLAFYSETQALFLDEPTTNLDKKATEWYLKNLALTQSDTLVLIASNQEHEYPANSIIVDISAYKKGY
jgi:ABC-type multidrug transport system ATPase subunit